MTGNDHFVTKSKQKQVLPIACVLPLKELAQKRLAECANEERLFGHICSRHTHRLFKKYLKVALPEKTYLNIHSLRHTCCIELLRAGGGGFIQNTSELTNLLSVETGLRLDHVQPAANNKAWVWRYTIFGIMGEKTWGSFTVFANFENIFDTRQTRFGPIFTGNDPIFRIFLPRWRADM